MVFDNRDSAALEEMAMSITRLASSVQDLVIQGQARMPANCKCTIAPLDPHENLRDAIVESEAYELDARAAADARLAEKSRVCAGCGLTFLRAMGHTCDTRTVVAEKDRPSGIDWRQKISSALGCKPGQITYQLEDCVQRIEAMVELVNRVQVRCDLCGYWYRHGDKHACRPKEAPVDNMIQKECQYCGHTELVSVDQLGKAQESGEALHSCKLGERIHHSMVRNGLKDIGVESSDDDYASKWLSYQFYRWQMGAIKPIELRRMLDVSGPQFQWLAGQYGVLEVIRPSDIAQARADYPSA